MNANVGLLINSSRGIIYASSGTDFAEQEQKLEKQEMEQFCLKCRTFKFSKIKISFLLRIIIVSLDALWLKKSK
jgi:hypothetical protein